ncbi:hypothetical protein EJ06DRAFT_527394 [Trichodelitschia bisporula]|uniref:RING-type domain-containing protein n=1 Tax=Trichodelitschia bisporula TaxID=703511 RepID=A0A6G1I6H8_9PEZI|nr:hypothetical protein EJ06DRAFT_527394 [Trichodelitschia bisporula]
MMHLYANDGFDSPRGQKQRERFRAARKSICMLCHSRIAELPAQMVCGHFACFYCLRQAILACELCHCLHCGAECLDLLLLDEDRDELVLIDRKELSSLPKGQLRFETHLDDPEPSTLSLNIYDGIFESGDDESDSNCFDNDNGWDSDDFEDVIEWDSDDSANVISAKPVVAADSEEETSED